MTYSEACSVVAKKYDLGNHLVTGHRDKYWSEAAQLYARECVKASLEKAADNAEVITVFGADDKEVVDKSSITSDSNIVLL